MTHYFAHFIQWYQGLPDIVWGLLLVVCGVLYAVADIAMRERARKGKP